MTVIPNQKAKKCFPNIYDCYKVNTKVQGSSVPKSRSSTVPIRTGFLVLFPHASLTLAECQ